MDRNLNLMQRKWDNITKTCSPVIASIQNGTFTANDLTKLSVAINRQSQLASSLFSKQVSAMRIQSATFSKEIESKLRTIGVDPSPNNIELVINDIFKKLVQRNIGTLLDQVKITLDQQADKMEKSTQSMISEYKTWADNQKKIIAPREEILKDIYEFCKKLPQETARAVLSKTGISSDDGTTTAEQIQSARKVLHPKEEQFIKRALVNGGLKWIVDLNLSSEAQAAGRKPLFSETESSVLKPAVVPDKKSKLEKDWDKFKSRAGISAEDKSIPQKKVKPLDAKAVMMKRKKDALKLLTKKGVISGDLDLVTNKDLVQALNQKQKAEKARAEREPQWLKKWKKILAERKAKKERKHLIKQIVKGDRFASLRKLMAPVRTAKATTKAIVAPVAAFIKDKAEKVASVRDYISNALGKLGGMGDSIKSILKTMFMSYMLYKFFKPFIDAALENFDLGKMVSGALDGVSNMISEKWQALKNTLTGWASSFSSTIKDYFKKISEKYMPKDTRTGNEEEIPGEQKKLTVGKDVQGRETAVVPNNDGTFSVNTFDTDKDGKRQLVKTARADYDPRPLPDGPYKGWIQYVKSEDDESGMTTNEFINPQTGEHVRELTTKNSPLKGPTAPTTMKLYKDLDKANATLAKGIKTKYVNTDFQKGTPDLKNTEGAVKSPIDTSKMAPELARKAVPDSTPAPATSEPISGAVKPGDKKAVAVPKTTKPAGGLKPAGAASGANSKAPDPINLANSGQFGKRADDALLFPNLPNLA